MIIRLTLITLGVGKNHPGRLKVRECMKEKYLKIKDMAAGRWSIQMAPSMKVIGLMICFMAMDAFFTRTAISTMALGKRVLLTAKVHIPEMMVQPILVLGLKTFSMVIKVRRHGLMVVNTVAASMRVCTTVMA